MPVVSTSHRVWSANWRAWTRWFLSNAVTGVTMLPMIVVLFSSAAAWRHHRISPRATRQEEATSMHEEASSTQEEKERGQQHAPAPDELERAASGPGTALGERGIP